MAYKSQVTITRPANTTAYAAGDVVGGAIAFPGAGPDSGTVLLASADLRIDVSAIPSGMTSFRLHLYTQTPPSALADNAVWDLPAGDRPYYAGYVDLGSPADVGSTLYCQADGVNKALRMYGQALYGYLVTNGAFTPAGNSEVYSPSIATVDL